jgi:ribose transport system substrate-binding protein
MNGRLWCAVAAALLLLGCDGNAPAPPAGGGARSVPPSPERELTIAVIPKGTTHEFWKSVHAGAQQAADELGNVKIEWKGSILESDREGQINVVQDFITRQVDGIVLAPLDSQSLIAPVLEAREAGIPTVIFDSALDNEEIIVSYVATDNYHGGELAALRLGEVLGGQGDVILLRYAQGSESTEQREEGFLSTLAEKFPEIHVLSSNQYSGTTPETSLDKCLQLLTQYADEVDGVFTVCEPNSTGMLGALEQMQLAGKVKAVAFDPSPHLVQSMKEGKTHGIVLQDPVKMGYLAVKTMAAHLRGETVEKRIGTGEAVATPENMDSDAMHLLLHPRQFGE